MSEEVKQENTTTETALTVNSADLSKEALEIINGIISEKDTAKANQLIELFNNNQNKKTIVRVNKLNDLLDKITDQTIERFEKKPDEISNQEILQALKIIQELAEKNQKQLTEKSAADRPLIQINQQNNELNLGGTDGLSKESRDRVKQAVAAILAGIPSATVVDTTIIPEDTKND